MRLFVAVNFPPPVRDAIHSALDDFPVSNPPWRWALPETWHLTLKFLGDTEQARVSALAQALENVARDHCAFEMTLGAFGGFPNLRHPRVLFYQVEEGAANLERLAHDVDVAIEHATGLALDARASRRRLRPA